MMTGIVVPLALAAVLGGAFLANEWSEGGVSTMMGMGRHHMFSVGHGTCSGHAPASVMPGAPCGGEEGPHG